MATALTPSVLSQFVLTPAAALLQTSLQEAALTATEVWAFRTRMEEQRIGKGTPFFHTLHLLEGRLQRGGRRNKNLVERGKTQLAADWEGLAPLFRNDVQVAAATVLARKQFGRLLHRPAGAQPFPLLGVLREDGSLPNLQPSSMDELATGPLGADSWFPFLGRFVSAYNADGTPNSGLLAKIAERLEGEGKMLLAAQTFFLSALACRPTALGSETAWQDTQSRRLMKTAAILHSTYLESISSATNPEESWKIGWLVTRLRERAVAMAAVEKRAGALALYQSLMGDTAAAAATVEKDKKERKKIRGVAAGYFFDAAANAGLDMALQASQESLERGLGILRAGLG